MTACLRTCGRRKVTMFHSEKASLVTVECCGVVLPAIEVEWIILHTWSVFTDSTPLMKDTGVFESYGRLIVVLLD